MNIQTSKAMTVACATLKATLNTLSDKVGDLPMQLYADFESRNTPPAGPMVFVYRGMDGDPDAEFDLQVCLPLDSASTSYNGRFETTTLEPFEHVQRSYVGPMETMGKKGYEPLFVDMAKAGLQANGQAREIYVNWVSPESAENHTDIQVGVSV